MPCLLKERTESSPGVITFTQNEVLWGALAQSDDVRAHLARTAAEGSWVYGVHIQGGLTPDRAREIAAILDAGPLPATLEPAG